MIRFGSLVVGAMATCGIMAAAEISTLQTYVDTDLCSHLLIGPISAERIGLQQEHAEGRL